MLEEIFSLGDVAHENMVHFGELQGKKAAHSLKAFGENASPWQFVIAVTMNATPCLCLAV